ncbi:MAG: DUF1893 domain-containing protein [Candidatus Aenigmatarchaeota archaeon]
MDDLNLAKNRLKEKNLTLVIAKNGKTIFESNSNGIKDLVLAIDLLKEKMKKSSVADSKVGKAAALLFIYSGINSIFAQTISKPAISILKNFKIPFEYENVVENILNKEKNDLCPFERLVLNCDLPGEAYKKIKSFFK